MALPPPPPPPPAIASPVAPSVPTKPEKVLAALRLYIIRHGKAERNSATGEDEDRKLKPRGERQSHYIAEQLKKQKKKIALLLHSPTHRAEQTGKLIAADLGCKRVEAECLAVDEPVRGILALINTHRHAGCVAVVGHNPTLENVAASIAPRQFKDRDVELRTGEVLVIEIAEGKPLSEGSLVGRWRLDEVDDD